MPKSSIKSASKVSYDVTYRVAGELSQLTSDERDALALRYLRAAARQDVVSRINAAEPAIITNKNMYDAMKSAGLGTPEQIDAFFKDKGFVLEVPTQFEIPIKELIPEESGRGKKAANIFEFGGSDDETETPEGETSAQ